MKLCLNKLTKQPYAVKMMAKYDLEKELVSMAEYDLMVNIKPHPNIVTAIEFISTEIWTYLVMELANGSEL